MSNFPIVEFHILQSFPVSCLNRDDVGAPKQAVVGGVSRARVSSQCWKRAVRLALHEQGITLGIRTKRAAQRIAAVLVARGRDEEAALKVAEAIAKHLTDDSLIFLSDKEYEALADYADSVECDAKKVKDKAVEKVIKKVMVTGVDGLDIALFGRMVAKVASMNVEAAAAFSHAISTHEVSSEIDFFTALDDDAQEPGSAHMGAAEFSSATYYRYVSLNLRRLADTLATDDPEVLKKAVSAFIKALYLAVPAARQSTMSASCPWDFARVLVRKGQRMQCSFETPVKAAREGGYLRASIEALKKELDAKEKRSGSLFGLVAKKDLGEDESSIDDLIQFVDSEIAK